MSTYPTLPSATITPVVPRAAVNSVARQISEQRVTLATGRRARLIYGRREVFAEIAAAKVAYPYLYILAVWGLGEIDSVESITFGDGLAVSSVSYTGTASQGVDPWLAAAISGYADNLRGTVNGRAVSLAYSVVRTSNAQINPADQLRGIIKGRKVYDPRTTTTAYSTNPALALADVLSASGETIDWTSVEDAADYCDESVSGETRWTIGIDLSDPSDIPSIADGLRAYAHCMIVRGSSGIRLVPDTTGTSAWSIGMGDIVEDSLRISRPGRSDTPTVVTVEYTRTDISPWGAARAQAVHPDVTAGTMPWRESAIYMPGVQSYQEAYRHALERLNAFTLRDLKMSVRVFDAGLKALPGAIVDVTHDIGLLAKQMRVLGVSAPEPGRWDLTLEEYDAAVYSDVIETEPTWADTSLPSPYDVPAVSSLAAAEEVYQLENGTYASRLRITWDGSAYVYDATYHVCAYDGAALVSCVDVTDEVAVLGPLQEGVVYDVRVAMVAAIGVTGPESSTLIEALGKQLIPSDVPSITGIEIGGEVRLSWQPATDIDIWRYEVRWGNTSATWDTATLLDRVDGLRLLTRDIPPGTFRFFVKAIDSIQQYSTNAVYVDITVTLDTRAFLVDQYNLTYSAAASSNIYEDLWRNGTYKRWSEIGTAAGTLFPSTASSYTDIAAAYDVGSASEWESAQVDFGQVYTGTFAFSITAFSALGSGDSITLNYEVSETGSAWDTYTTSSFKASARYARIRVTAASTNALLQNGTPSVRLDVVVREESGTVTTNASAAATVTLSQDYDFANWVGLTPSGTAARYAVYDNIVVGSSPASFDVYLFDSSGTQISGDVAWRFQGV